MLLAFWLGTEREGLGGELVGVLNILNIWRRAVIGALACLALIAPQASAAPAQTSPDLRRLVQQGQRSRDGVDARAFDEIYHRCLERAGLPYYRFHDLRHSFAAAWVSNGGSLYKLQQILGHASPTTNFGH